MRSGKFNEELSRISEILDHIRPGAMTLLNESFAATDERERTEITRQIVGDLLGGRIRIVYVSHLHDFAQSMFGRKLK